MTALSEDKTKAALQVAAGVLEAIRPYCLLEIETKFRLQHDGHQIGSFTIDEALDMADAALAPEPEARS